jgi:hypothetical protein
LSGVEWNLLSNIRNAYEDYCIRLFVESHQRVPLIPTKQPYRSRLKLQRLVDLKYKYVTVVASFVKHVLQFDTFSLSTVSDYSYLKDSFQCLITPNTCELMKSKVLDNIPWEHDRLAFESVLSDDIIRRLTNVLETFQALVPHDPIIMKLSLIILALSSRIIPLVRKERYDDMDFHPLPRNFLSSQNYYLTLLWKYILHRLGYHDAVLFSVRFIQTFLRRQRIEADITDIVYNRDNHEQLIDLVQTSMVL